MSQARKSLAGNRFIGGGPPDSLAGRSLGHGSYSTWVHGQEYSHFDTYDPVEDALHAEEMMSKRRKLKFRELFRYATSTDWTFMALGVILALLGSTITPWLYFWSGMTLHDVVVYERCHPTKDLETGMCSVPGYCEHTLPEVGARFARHIFFAWVLFIAAQVLYNACFTIAADRQTKKIRNAYFQSTVRKDMAWFDLCTDRDFAKAMTEEVTHIRLGIGDVIPTLINLTSTVIAMIVVVFCLNHKVAFTFLGFVPVSLIMVYIGNWAETRRSHVADDRFQIAHMTARDDLVNIKIIKMYEGENVQSERFARALDSHGERAETKWMFIAAISSGTVWLVLNIATALIFWVGGGVYETNEQFCASPATLYRNSFFKKKYLDTVEGFNVPDGPGEMLLVYFGLMFITVHSMDVPSLLTLIKIAKQNASSVFFVIDWKSRIDNFSTEGKIPKHSAIGRLDFEQVTFRYPKKPHEQVLSLEALTIFSGQFVVFAGPARSGKGTILKLIPRLYDVCSGYITLDAINLQNYNLSWLRQQIFLLTEEPTIFTGTISENLLFGKLSASQAEVVRACELANVHDAIQALPNGYNTVISSKESEDGLTRNEKRQICLARGYLHKSRVILLDNPIKNEDDPMESLLLKYVNSVRETATVIMASTYVNGLSKRADCIYYMENGKILEHGNHIQLIQAKGKYYSRLEETINCSLESKKQFDSQLKAYKVNQLLQRKKSSELSGAVPSTAQRHSDRSSGGVVGGTETRHSEESSKESRMESWGFLDNFLNLLHIGGSYSSQRSQTSKRSSLVKPTSISSADYVQLTGIQSQASLENLDRAERVPKLSSKTDIEKQASENDVSQPHQEKGPADMQLIVQQHEQAMKAAGLEEAYAMHRFSVESGRHSLDRYMHHGFGLMGFQRMNFSRPMSTISNQLQKHHHALVTKFLPRHSTQGHTKVGPLGHKVSSYKSFWMSLFNRKTPSKTKHTKGSPFVGHSKSERLEQKRQSVVRFSLHQEAPHTGSSHKIHKKSLSTKHSPSKVFAFGDLNSETTPQSEQPAEISGSMKDVVKSMSQDMTGSGSALLNENIEINTTELQSSEMDEFLAEYDEGIYSTINSSVTGSWGDIFSVCKHDWIFVIPGVLVSIILGLSIPGQTIVLGWFFHGLGYEYESEPEHQTHNLKLILYMLGIGMLTGVAAFLQEVCFCMAGKRMTHNLRMRLYSHILTQDLTWFDEKSHDIGILTYQLYADTTIIHHALLFVYGIMLQAVTTIGVSIAIAVLWANHNTLPLTLGYVAAMPVLIYMVYFCSQQELTRAVRLDKKFESTCDFTQEYISHITTWMSLGAEPNFVQRHQQKLDREGRRITLSTIGMTLLRSCVQTSCWVLYGLFLYFVLRYPKTASSPTSSFGNWVMGSHDSLFSYIIITTELLIFGAYRIGDQVVILGDTDNGKTAAHKIRKIMKSRARGDFSEAKVNWEMRNQLKDLVPPTVSLTNVCYSYPGTPQPHRGSLDGVTLSIPPCSYVAIVGPPNSGKSTLCNILLRMLEPQSGVVEFGEVDCSQISPKLMRKFMGFVEYDPCLFDFSIEDNIKFGNCNGDIPSDVSVEEAAKMAICHFDILGVPGDYNADVFTMDKTAHNFSLKQRISYARAFVRDPKILVIDDATSSIDTESDHKMLEVITNVREDRTLVVFSHQIEPVRDADLIYVLWEGKLVECGTDADLLNMQGYYYEMYMTQRVLAETMRNSPTQMKTIRYNIKNVLGSHKLNTGGSSKIRDMIATQGASSRPSSVAYVKFLGEKLSRIKAEKEQRRNELEHEVSELEKERQRESGK